MTNDIPDGAWSIFGGIAGEIDRRVSPPRVLREPRAFRFNDDAASQVFAFLARRGAGKTYAAGVFAESLLHRGVQVIVLTPLPNWWGLRVLADGKRASPFHVPILGGRHGDIALVPSGGAAVAAALVESSQSAVLDVSAFRKGQRREFVTAFAEDHATPVHLIIEEAQVFVPQRVPPGHEAMLGAMEDICRLGRNYGIGVSFVSQRPQSINKDVLNQAECLVLLQTSGPHEKAAIRAWVDEQDADRAREMLDTLPRLQRGEALVWSPSWMRCFERVTVRRKLTFDSTATPTEAAAVQTRTKPLDLVALRSALEAAGHREEDADPKKLRAEVERLRGVALRLTTDRDAARGAFEVADAARIAAETAGRGFRGVHLTALLDMRRALAVMDKQLDDMIADANGLVPVSGVRTAGEQTAQGRVKAPEQHRLERASAENATRVERAVERLGGRDVGARSPDRRDAAPLPKGEAAVLDAVLTCGGHLGRDGISVMTGYKRSARDAYVSRLKAKGYVETTGDAVRVTATGRAVCDGPGTEALTGRALYVWWKNRLPFGEAAVLDAVVSRGARTKEDVARHVSYKRSALDAYVSRLRARRLIDTDRGRIEPSALLDA